MEQLKEEILLNEENDILEDEFTKCKCLHCGYEQDIPTWLIDEICDMNEECDLDDHFITGCYQCNEDAMVTIAYYNSIKHK